MYNTQFSMSNDSFSRDGDSIDYSVTSSDNYNSHKKKFQNIRQNRFSHQSSLQTSSSAFDLSNPNYLVGNAPRARSASPHKATPRPLHLRPHTMANQYEIPIPVNLIRPPLISDVSKRNSIEINNKKPPVNTHQKTSSINNPFLMKPVVPEQRPQSMINSQIKPSPIHSVAPYNHSKTYSMPIIDFHKSSTALNKSEFEVNHKEINTSALFNGSELKELEKLKTNETFKSMEEVRLKKKKKFWIFGRKKKNNSDKNTVHDDKKLTAKRESIINDDETLNASTESFVHDIPVPTAETESTSKLYNESVEELADLSKEFTKSTESLARSSFEKPNSNIYNYNHRKTQSMDSNTSFKNSIYQGKYKEMIKQSHQNNNNNVGYKIKDKNGYFVFTPESESLGMKASPSTYRTNSGEFPIRNFSNTSSLSSNSQDPNVLYSPINDTFSLASDKNSSIDTISTLETKEMTFGENYNLFTNNAVKEKDPYEKILDDSVYSELDSEFVINKDYSLADIEEEEVEDEDKTHILADLKEEEEEEEDSEVILNNTDNLLESLNINDDFQESEFETDNFTPSEYKTSVNYEASDYEDLIKNYTGEYSESETNENYRNYGSEYSESASNENFRSHKSLELIHYYELNSSKSTFQPQQYQQQQQKFVDRGYSDYGADSRVVSQNSERILRVINNSRNLSNGSAINNSGKRDFSFAESIASDIQFQNNVGVKKNEYNYNINRNPSLTNSSVLYYSDSDLVKNPTFASNDDNAWESVTDSSSVSDTGSTLLSAVNSLYGDYIKKNGYKNIEDLCYKKSVTLPEAIRQIKIATGENLNRNDSVFSADSDFYTPDPNNNRNSLMGFLQSKRKPDYRLFI